MQTLPPTFKRVIKIFWALAWRTLLFCVAAGAAIGFLVGFIGSMTGMIHDPAQVQPLITLPIYVASIIIQYFVLRYILNKNFGEFRIALIAQEPNTTNDGVIP